MWVLVGCQSSGRPRLGVPSEPFEPEASGPTVTVVSKPPPTQAGITCIDAPLPLQRPADGTPLPEATAQALTVPLEQLDAAQSRRDRTAIAAAVCAARRALGEFQGVAEAAAEYGGTDDDVAAPATVFSAYLDSLGSIPTAYQPWLSIPPPTRGGDLSVALRTPCDVVSWYVEAAGLLPNADSRRSQLIAKARAGLAWLRSVQRADGVFPVPDLSDDHDVYMADCNTEATPDLQQQCRDAVPRLFFLGYSAKQAWLSAGSPADVLVDGWFVRDVVARDGGLQFDTGTCGRAFLRAYALLGDASYLDAARAAVTWAKQQPEVLNWNYNSFSVGLLAHFALLQPGGDEAQQALSKARFGVLPGALADGRWYDPHNAKLVYHHILMENLALLDQVVDDPWLSLTLEAANRRSVLEIVSRGSSDTNGGIPAYVQASRAGVDPGIALDILVHHATQLQGANQPSISSGSVIEWLSDVL